MRLSVEQFSFSYGRRPILSDLSFSLSGGQFLAVLGPNGAGKSTLFRCILGALSGYQGRISLDGREIGTLSQRDLARAMAYIPQIHRPTFGYTVLETVLMGTTHQFSAISQPGASQVEQALAALRSVGIESLAERNFAQLSGGEQQLVLVARALAQQASILIMDEPTASLDYGNQLRVLEQVKALAAQGYAVLLSTHNPQHALTFSSHILALSNGKAAAYGTPDTVLTPALIRQLYGVSVTFAQVASSRVITPLTEDCL